MESDYSISEEFLSESIIEESFIPSNSEKTKTEQYSNKFESGDLQSQLLKQKINLLNKKAKLSLPRLEPNPKSEIFTLKIAQLQTFPKKTDAFYKQKVDENLLQKLQFTNKLFQINLGSDCSSLQAENKILQEKCEKIKKQKFIEAQYFRLLSKP